jgi:hypothetical protein
MNIRVILALLIITKKEFENQETMLLAFRLLLSEQYIHITVIM